MQYESNPESLQHHTVPEWYHNAKLGIFIHWGLPSVPGWAPLTGEMAEIGATEGWETFFARNPYSEWYLNSLRIKGSPTYQHHLETYGENFSYDDFIPRYNKAVEQWNPDEWAKLFQKVGARYVVLVTKHHDGFLLWPSERTSPYKNNYCTQRNIVGELSSAVRQCGLRMGMYYSGGLDWSFNKTVIKTRPDVYSTIVQTPEFIEYADYHFRELIDRYQTALLWNDIGYPVNANVLELFAYYYNTVPDGVINDRFGQLNPETVERDLGEAEEAPNPAGIHFDFTTPEYATYGRIMKQKWETCRGIGYSFAYNQAEGPDSYLSAERLIPMFVDIVSKNGNLLLNIGPMADGTIPELQRKCLEGLGEWLDVNGEAIFDTRPWVKAEGDTNEKIPVRFTQKGDALFAILLDTPPGDQVTIQSLPVAGKATIHLLGHEEKPLPWHQDGNNLTIMLPNGVAKAPAHAFKITLPPER